MNAKTITSNICDRCGDTIEDIDAGFSPALQGMRHDCGGTWRRPSAIVPTDETDFPMEDAAAPRLMDYYTGDDIRAATAEEIDASADAGPEGVILLAADGAILQADDAGADDAQRVYVAD